MTDTPDPDQPEFPALSDAELRETVDLMATAVASMSNRIDGLTKAANRQIAVSTEARIAAFAARDQTNPKKYGELVGATIDGKINDNLVRMGQMCVDLFNASNRAQDALKKAEEDKSVALRQVWEREQKAERLKSHLPWFGLGALVLALVMTVALPRFLASHPSTCAVLGASWTTTTTGVDACVFYRE
jgi:cytochrome oxidase assembly protein ShyY1